jgi:hypothetical protein
VRHRVLGARRVFHFLVAQIGYWSGYANCWSGCRIPLHNLCGRSSIHVASLTHPSPFSASFTSHPPSLGQSDYVNVPLFDSPFQFRWNRILIYLITSQFPLHNHGVEANVNGFPLVCPGQLLFYRGAADSPRPPSPLQSSYHHGLINSLAHLSCSQIQIIHLSK